MAPISDADLALATDRFKGDTLYAASSAAERLDKTDASLVSRIAGLKRDPGDPQKKPQVLRVVARLEEIRRKIATYSASLKEGLRLVSLATASGRIDGAAGATLRKSAEKGRAEMMADLKSLIASDDFKALSPADQDGVRQTRDQAASVALDISIQSNKVSTKLQHLGQIAARKDAQTLQDKDDIAMRADAEFHDRQDTTSKPSPEAHAAALGRASAEIDIAIDAAEALLEAFKKQLADLGQSVGADAVARIEDTVFSVGVDITKLKNFGREAIAALGADETFAPGSTAPDKHLLSFTAVSARLGNRFEDAVEAMSKMDPSGRAVAPLQAPGVEMSVALHAAWESMILAGRSHPQFETYAASRRATPNPGASPRRETPRTSLGREFETLSQAVRVAMPEGDTGPELALRAHARVLQERLREFADEAEKQAGTDAPISTDALREAGRKVLGLALEMEDIIREAGISESAWEMVHDAMTRVENKTADVRMLSITPAQSPVLTTPTHSPTLTATAAAHAPPALSANGSMARSMEICAQGEVGITQDSPRTPEVAPKAPTPDPVVKGKSLSM